MAQSMFGHNVGVWIGVNDRQIENTYINSDGSGVDWLNWNDGVREVFPLVIYMLVVLVV